MGRLVMGGFGLWVMAVGEWVEMSRSVVGGFGLWVMAVGYGDG